MAFWFYRTKRFFRKKKEKHLYGTITLFGFLFQKIFFTPAERRKEDIKKIFIEF